MGRVLHSERMKASSLHRIVRGRNGQTAVEYLLTTVVLVTVFAGMYGYLQGQLKTLFTKAGVRILSTYPK
jgi:Flp pilus assembly pilin Flp